MTQSAQKEGGMHLDHQDYMRLALDLAKSGKGQTRPNPIVGAVVVKDGRIVGIGAHLKAGEAHAEVHALTMAGSQAEGATVYVTLEPCSHHGKTPPCTDLLIEKGIRRVFVAATDPNPRVAGIEKLRKAGIPVEVGLLQQEAEALNEMFFHYIRTNTPFVTLKSAISLDGKIATVGGESQWITGKASRYDVHRYRDEHDAILVGVNTVIADNPSLTTRLEGEGKNPIRIVLDHQLRTPTDANIVRDGEAQTWIVTTQATAAEKRFAYEQNGVKILSLPGEKIEIDPLLKRLGAEGIISLFVEGGAIVNGSFLEARAIQRVITYMSPKLLGGKTAPTSFGGAGIIHLENAFQLEIESVEKLGEDIKIVSRKA
jgi:diaminohydroxyphosphoribosylaminopyrimidine deaminase/5-amino-6-(5-phosphoribosylamino)uracil reductase